MKIKMVKRKDVDINIKVKGVDKLVKKRGIDKIKCCSWYGTCRNGGASFGAALAMILSFMRNNSILWAIIHGILNWFYVIYRIIQAWGGI